ncbi:TlpA disulfide reductase family protein [Micromonospora sp. NPDC050200]|uniref:TlpA family protein disulfide reductase n=1 Tax=Micromonospora sp. NPDC050200 TaxID=3155664 RepID=UPI0033DC7EC1
MSRSGIPRPWWRRPPVAAALTLALAVGAALALRPTSDPATGDAASGPAPALAGTTLDGGRFDLADARGQVVLVNVFASWCGPCRDELPLLAEAERRWSDRGVRLVGLDVRDGPEAVRALLKETGTTGLVVLPDPDGTRSVDWGVRGVPETFVVDRQGRIVARQRGVVTARWLEQQVTPLLGAA